MKVAACKIAFGAKLCNSTSLVAQPAQEAARQRGEAAFVVPDEADHVAVRRVGLPIRRQWDYPCRGLPVHIWCQLSAILELVQRELHHCRAVPRQLVHHGDRLRESHVDRRRSTGAKRMLGESKEACSALERKQGARDDGR
jgi:hypothetical protein